jgi:hypothetical protein
MCRDPPQGGSRFSRWWVTTLQDAGSRPIARYSFLHVSVARRYWLLMSAAARNRLGRRRRIHGSGLESHFDRRPSLRRRHSPAGNFPRDRWVNGRKPTVKLTVRQDGAQLCYVIDGIAEAPVIRYSRARRLRSPCATRSPIQRRWKNCCRSPVSVSADWRRWRTTRRHGCSARRKHEITGRTNLHVHGFAVPPVAPQDEVLMGCADPAVGSPSCGQREITYHYQIPPDMPPGLYWYHPHMHGEVQAQMLAGLTGAIVVEGPDDQARNDAGIPDRVFIVRQLQDTDGKAGSWKRRSPVAAPRQCQAPRSVRLHATEPPRRRAAPRYRHLRQWSRRPHHPNTTATHDPHDGRPPHRHPPRVRLHQHRNRRRDLAQWQPPWSTARRRTKTSRPFP